MLKREIELLSAEIIRQSWLDVAYHDFKPNHTHLTYDAAVNCDTLLTNGKVDLDKVLEWKMHFSTLVRIIEMDTYYDDDLSLKTSIEVLKMHMYSLIRKL